MSGKFIGMPKNSRKRGTLAKNRTAALERQERAARWYAQGVSQTEIAKRNGVSQAMTSMDIKAVRERWLASSLVSFDEMRAAQLAKIDQMEAIAWEEFHKSQRGELTVSKRVRKALRDKLEAELTAVAAPSVANRTTSPGDRFRTKLNGRQVVAKMRKEDAKGEKEMVPIEETTDRVRRGRGAGDPEWVRIAQWCIRERSHLLGLIKPPDTVVNANVGIDWRSIHVGEAKEDAVEARIQEAEVLAIEEGKSQSL